MPDSAGVGHAGAVAARDLDEARAVGGSVYFPHRLRCTGDRSAFAMRLRRRTVGPVTVGVLGYDAEVHIETTQELGTAYEINVPLHGAMDCWVGGRHVAGAPNRAVVNGPTATSTLHGFGPGRALFGLKVDRRALEDQHRVLGDRRGDTLPTLRPWIALDQDDGRRWWSLARLLLEGLDGPPGPMDSPLVVGPLVEALLRGLLVVAGEDRAGPEPVGLGPASLRIAVDFLRAHAGEPLTVTDIAAAAGCCVRALQQGFQRHLDTTPMAYLRQVRLAGAHAALRDADPRTVTVTEVSWRWGFTHAGRFASAYRQRYGVSPSTTLRLP